MKRIEVNMGKYTIVNIDPPLQILWWRVCDVFKNLKRKLKNRDGEQES